MPEPDELVDCREQGPRVPVVIGSVLTHAHQLMCHHYHNPFYADHSQHRMSIDSMEDDFDYQNTGCGRQREGEGPVELDKSNRDDRAFWECGYSPYASKAGLGTVCCV